MRLQAIFASTLVHGTVIVGVGLWVQPWVHFSPRLRLGVIPEEPVPEVLARLPEPARVRVQPLRDVEVVEKEPSWEEPEPEVEAQVETFIEPPLPLPYPTPKAIPELIHRVLPVVVEPAIVAEKAAEDEPTEESLEPKLPQDYVRKLQLDPRNKPPRYPPLARRMGVEGKVVIAVTVTAAGGVKNVRVLSSAGSSAAHQQMDRAALRALRRWHYPRILRGEGDPLEMVIHVPVEFRLVDTKG